MLDARSGATKATHQLTDVYQKDQNIFINDVTQDEKGNIYATDVINPVIYKIDAQGIASVYLEKPEFFTSAMLLGFDIALPSSVRTLFVVEMSASSLSSELMQFDCVTDERDDG